MHNLREGHAGGSFPGKRLTQFFDERMQGGLGQVCKAHLCLGNAGCGTCGGEEMYLHVLTSDSAH